MALYCISRREVSLQRACLGRRPSSYRPPRVLTSLNTHGVGPYLYTGDPDTPQVPKCSVASFVVAEHHDLNGLHGFAHSLGHGVAGALVGEGLKPLLKFRRVPSQVGDLRLSWSVAAPNAVSVIAKQMVWSHPRFCMRVVATFPCVDSSCLLRFCDALVGLTFFGVKCLLLRCRQVVLGVVLLDLASAVTLIVIDLCRARGSDVGSRR